MGWTAKIKQKHPLLARICMSSNQNKPANAIQWTMIKNNNNSKIKNPANGQDYYRHFTAEKHISGKNQSTNS